MKESFAIIAVLLTILGNVPYIRDVLRGKVQPHAYTWFVWSLVSGIVLFGQIVKGAGVGALPTAVGELFTISIFFLSLRNGFKHVTKTDLIFLGMALVGISLWLFTKDPTLSVIIAVLIDFIAFVPTLRKAWREPGTENVTLYGANVMRHILILASLQTYNIVTMLHSIAMFATNLVMSLILLIAQNRRNKGRGGETKGQ